MRVTIRVDASPRIGGGHAMRCLTLADALTARGAVVTFVSALLPPSLEERVAGHGHRLIRIAHGGGLAAEHDDWDSAVLPEAEQRDDAGRTIAGAGRADWLVVDHYRLDRTWHQAARAGAAKMMVIDDLANRSLDCDVLLDETLGRTVADYRPWVPERAQMLLGPQFALLRPEFARERPAALARRQANGDIRRILISLGTTDVGGLTGRALDAVRNVAGECAIDVVLGSGASSVRAVAAIAAADSRVSLHVDSENMAQLMRDADLAVGAAGTTSWERCCVGLPTALFVLALNQRDVAVALVRAGAAKEVRDPAELTTIIAELIGDPSQVARMSSYAAEITDGGGTERAVQEMCALEVPAR